MQTFNINKNADQFLALCRENIKRPGLEPFLSWLLRETDFEKAPCSTKYHLNVPGGLCQHSMNVYTVLMSLASDFGYDITKQAETLSIISLFHDVCKVNFYKPTMLSKKIAGRWESVPGYEVDDLLPLGHGEKSCMLILRYMPLTDEELLAIRWHMGPYDDACKGSYLQLGNAQAKSKLVTLLHCADLLATQMMED